jgi:hypothetical protein
MIKGVCYKQMTSLIDDNAEWVAQTRFQGWTSISSISWHPLSGHPVNPTGRTIPSPHEMIIRIRNVEIAPRIKRDSRWA